MVLKILLFFFSNVNMKFAELKKPNKRSYNIAEALPNTSKVTLMNKKKFAKAANNKNSKIIIINVRFLGAKIFVYLV